jgi:hypothetical protein
MLPKNIRDVAGASTASYGTNKTYPCFTPQIKIYRSQKN